MYNPTNGAVLTVGTNTLTVVFTPSNSNYTTVPLSVALVVTPAPLSVTANDASRMYGKTNPVFSGTLTGVVNGDNITATYSTSATTNSPAGSYPIVPSLVDPNGRLANYTVTSTSGALTVTNATPQFGILQGTNVFNPQTGLYEQRDTVTNTGAITVAAVRLLVGGLRTNVFLYNATGTNAGRPYVQYNSPLNPGQSVTFLLEFYVGDRHPFTNTLEAQAVLPSPAGTNSGAGVAISRAFMDNRIAGQPRFVIEFASVPGRTYTVIYSDDSMATWQVATPTITANATSTQYYDDGPPKTVSPPLSIRSRLYRVISND